MTFEMIKEVIAGLVVQFAENAKVSGEIDCIKTFVTALSVNLAYLLIRVGVGEEFSSCLMQPLTPSNRSCSTAMLL